MSRKKYKNDRINANFSEQSFYLKPGLYKLFGSIQNNDLSDLYYTNDKFIVKKHIENIGQQSIEYYSITKLGSTECQIKSYQASRWNTIAAFLWPMKDDIYNLESMLSNIDRKQLDVIIKEMAKSGMLDLDKFNVMYDITTW